MSAGVDPIARGLAVRAGAAAGAASAAIASGIAVPLPFASPGVGSPIRVASEDPASPVPRVVPPGFDPPPFAPAQVRGPGDVVLTRSAAHAFLSSNPGVATSAIAYVSPTGGAPGNAVLGDRTKPFSLAHAVQTLTTAQLIVALDGVYPPLDFRSTHVAGGMKKAVITERRGGAAFRVAGLDVTSATWAATAGQADMWQTSWTTTHGGVGVHRMTRGDVLDAKGYPARLFRCGSQAALSARASGYWADTAGKTLFVKLGGVDVNAVRGALRAYWTDANGSSRCFVSATEVLIDGFVADGVAFSLIEAGGVAPTLWLDNVQQQFCPGYGVGDFGSASARAYATRWRCHASESDGINLNPGTIRRAGAVLGDCWISEAGDFAGLGANGVANKQSVSMHGGDVMAFGCLFEDGYGQAVADTSTDVLANRSWYVGCLARRDGSKGDTSTGFGIYGWAGDGTSARDRTAWLDTCAAVGFDRPLDLQSGASAKLLASPTLSPAFVFDGSVQPGSYAVGAP